MTCSAITLTHKPSFIYARNRALPLQRAALSCPSSRLFWPSVGMLFMLFSSSSSADIIAYDMSNNASLLATDSQLVSFTNQYANAFDSSDDGFGHYRFDANDIDALPQGLTDLTAYGRLDNQGLIFDDGQSFFGVVDSVNVNNPGAFASARWEFDVSHSRDLVFSANFAAMGDFENSDQYNLIYSFDDTTWFDIFNFETQSSLSMNYQMDDGSFRQLNDPLSIETNNNGIDYNLSNRFETYSSDLAGNGERLFVELWAYADGGTEAFAMSDMVISGDVVSGVDPDLISVSEPGGILLFATPLILGLVARRRKFIGHIH